MSKKKIVSIEDRIPKLKEQRKKKANRRLVTYLSVFFILVLTIVYLQTPLSDIKSIEINGVDQTSRNQIAELSDLSIGMNIWSINKNETETTILSSPEIRSAEVRRELPSTISIDIQEYDHVGYLLSKGTYFPLLESGKQLQNSVEQPSGDAPLLVDFNDEKIINEMSGQLKKLPDNIRHLISEIHWVPESGDPNKLKLYMVDGFVVDGTIRNFSERMSAYPSIVSQLDPDAEGIVHIGVGAYFESFKSESDNTEESDENIDPE